MPAVVQVPTTVQQLDQVRSLMRSFIAWHKLAGSGVDFAKRHTASRRPLQ